MKAMMFAQVAFSVQHSPDNCCTSTWPVILHGGSIYTYNCLASAVDGNSFIKKFLTGMTQTDSQTQCLLRDQPGSNPEKFDPVHLSMHRALLAVMDLAWDCRTPILPSRDIQCTSFFPVSNVFIARMPFVHSRDYQLGS